MVPMLKGQIAGMRRKYPAEYDEAVVRAQLDKLRAALKRQPTGQKYLLGEFTFAGTLPRRLLPASPSPRQSSLPCCDRVLHCATSQSKAVVR